MYASSIQADTYLKPTHVAVNELKSPPYLLLLREQLQNVWSPRLHWAAHIVKEMDSFHVKRQLNFLISLILLPSDATRIFEWNFDRMVLCVNRMFSFLNSNILDKDAKLFLTSSHCPIWNKHITTKLQIILGERRWWAENSDCGKRLPKRHTQLLYQIVCQWPLQSLCREMKKGEANPLEFVEKWK